MITLRIKSENGTLKCEYSEASNPKSTKEYWIKMYESSFQPITLSEEAREYLMAIYTSSFGFEAALLPDELSDKSTECFEVKQIPMESNAGLGGYILHLKESVPVAENVEQSITPQPTDDELKKLGKELLKVQTEMYNPFFRVEAVPVSDIIKVFAKFGIDLNEKLPF